MRARIPFIIGTLTILAGSGAAVAEDINVWSSTNIQVQNGQDPIIHHEVRTTQDGVQQQVFVQDTQQIQVQESQPAAVFAGNETSVQQVAASAPSQWNLPFWQTSLPGTQEFEEYFRGIFSQMGWTMQQWPNQMFVQSAPAAHILVYLNGFQECPSVNTPAFGIAHVMVEGNVLRYSIDVQNLSSPITDAHFHMAPPGVSGPAVHSISFNGSHAEGTWNLSEQDRQNIQQGAIYLNVHTQQYPQGEIRGQL